MTDNGEELRDTDPHKISGDNSDLVKKGLRSDVFEYTFPNQPIPRLKPHPLITFLIGLTALILVLFVVVAFSPYGLTFSEDELAIAWHQSKRYHYVYSPNSNIKWVGVNISDLIWIKIRPILICLCSLAVTLWLKHLNLHPFVVTGFRLKGRNLSVHYLHGPSKVFQIPRWSRARVEPSPSDQDEMRYGPPAMYLLEVTGPFYLQIDTTDTYYGVNLGVGMKKSELKMLAKQINEYLDAQEPPSAD